MAAGLAEGGGGEGVMGGGRLGFERGAGLT